MKVRSANEAIEYVKSNSSIFIHTGAAAPQQLGKALADASDRLSNITIYQLHTEGKAPYADEKHGDTFHIRALFVGESVRNAIWEGRGSYIPLFLSEVPAFINSLDSLDYAFLNVSPPDSNGFCSLGVSIDTSRIAALKAKTLIAQINPNMPRTHGDSFIHLDDIEIHFEVDDPIPEVLPPELSDTHKRIGTLVSDLIEDGATLQMGIGAVPNAVLASLGNHQNLGIHTEMFSDGILPLLEKGVINNSQKAKHKGKVVSSFVIGSRNLYNFLDDNPQVRMLDCDYVNNTYVIAQNPKVTAINSAIEIDVTGQVCADSIGHKIFSGVGGQMDFIRGASLSKGGKPIIALPTTTAKGKSKIVPELHRGVVTTRSHVHYVVTEYGVANLYGKSLKQRAHELIKIAHPDHREALERDCFKIHKHMIC